MGGVHLDTALLLFLSQRTGYAMAVDTKAVAITNKKRSTRAILDKYHDYLLHKYGTKGWDVQIVERTNNGTAGVWGIIHMIPPQMDREPIVIRVHPWRGVDRVKYRNKRYFRTRVLLTRKQLQFRFGYAPAPRPYDKELFPYSTLSEDVEEKVSAWVTRSKKRRAQQAATGR